MTTADQSGIRGLVTGTAVSVEGCLSLACIMHEREFVRSESCGSLRFAAAKPPSA